MSTRTESSPLKRTMRVLLALAMALYFAPGLLLTPQNAWATPSITGSTATVNNLDDLQTAIANSSVNTIVVTTSIALSDGTTIDGGGKTIQVEKPYVNADGTLSSSGCSTNGVFSIDSNATVSLSNMTIHGGNHANAGGIEVKEDATLIANNVNITRSYRGLYIGSGATASLTNCNIVRNVCTFGGGAVCAGGTLVMDGCSLSENRSTSGGGGAIEVKGGGNLYANNTVIADNSSIEIGGGINVYGSPAYLMNCTVTNNTTSDSSSYKTCGGIGIHSASAPASLDAVNCIIAGNSYVSASSNAASDIGILSGSCNLHYCLYGSIGYTDSNSYATDNPNTATSVDGLLGSRQDKDGATYYPAVTGKAADGNGAVTYCDLTNLAAIKMSYSTGSINTSLGVLGTAENKVTSFFEGPRRDDDHPVIGASATVAAPAPPTPPVYIPEPDPTPSVTPSSPTGIDDFGTISGVSDRMEYKLEGTDAWTDVPADVTQLTGLPAGTYLIRYKGYGAYTKVVVAAAPAYSVEVKPAAGGTATADKTTAMKGEAIIFSATADKGFNLRGWMIGDEFIEADSITMPASDITVEPVFTPVQKLFTANAKASTGRATLSWKQVEGAVKYRVYLAKADGKLKRVTTIEVPAAEEGEVIDEAAIQAACAYTAKKLKAGIIYKLHVIAVAEDGSKISSSPIAYVTPKGKSYANATKLSVSKKSISLGAGEKAKFSAKVTGLDSKGKKLLKVSGVKKIRYMSSEPTIVKVTKYGNITALRAGTAYVYAIAADGVYKRIKVTVE